MISHPQRIFLGGLLVGAVGIASYVLQSDKDVFPGDQPGAEHPGASVFGALDSRPITTPRIDLNSIDPTSNSSVAEVLQAVHDSLQRNDLASAKVLLDAVRTYHHDDDRSLALQNELQAREGKVTGSPTAVSKDAGPKLADEPRRVRHEAPRMSAKFARAHSANVAAMQTRASNLPANAGVRVASASNVGGSNAGGSAAVSSPPAAAAREPVVAAQRLPSPAPEIAPPVSTEPAPVVVAIQPEVPQAAPAVVKQGPKTRAQIRAELEEARSDGSMPRFGNPDPAGPGVSTISSQPAP